MKNIEVGDMVISHRIPACKYLGEETQLVTSQKEKFIVLFEHGKKLKHILKKSQLKDLRKVTTESNFKRLLYKYNNSALSLIKFDETDRLEVLAKYILKNKFENTMAVYFDLLNLKKMKKIKLPESKLLFKIEQYLVTEFNIVFNQDVKNFEEAITIVEAVDVLS